jgi:O-succinylbenzoic acid--CoA ligase
LNNAQFIYQYKAYTTQEFIALKSLPDWAREIQGLIVEFQAKNDFLVFQTSGSTGVPKKIVHPKSRLIASAKRTLDFFNLKEGASAVLVLPAQFTGGAMMVIRTLVGGLKLHVVQPSLTPEIPNDVDFLPCTPAQYGHLERTEGLADFKGTVLLGGATVPVNMPSNGKVVYVGYGMTETASHVALRLLEEEYYIALEGVRFSLNEGCLCISDEVLGIDKLVTNDIVTDLDGDRFMVAGRSDNTINSGGLKINPEQWEEVFNQYDEGCCLSSIPDDDFGERLVLVLEKEYSVDEILLKMKGIESNRQPKWYICGMDIPKLPSGKMDRIGVKNHLKAHLHLLSPLESA